MATTEPLNASDRIEKADGVNGVEESESTSAVKSEGPSAEPEQSSSTPSATNPASSSKDVSTAGQDQASATATARNTPLNGSTPTTTLSMPHPKKFSHIDINKRFLEKNSAASSTGHASSPSIANKSGSALQKPSTPMTMTHSRLVTAKLTTDTQRSSTTGPGWSRPSSASSSAAATPSAAAAVPKALPTPSSSSAAPQLPVAGKVIQPQPRGAVEAAPLSRKESAGKAAWGVTKPPSAVQTPADAASEEFPTAAEAAQAKHVDKKTPAPTDEKKPPQATDEEADAFRGRHLDPNVHHWDDDDNDDSNFLDEVIEFDDGRQYTVQHTQDAEDNGVKADEAHSSPVSKEDRFADDFDRSWPPSRAAKHPTESSQQPLRSPSVSSQSLHSPQDSSRVLFNERSNRLEPYSSNRFSGPSRDSYFPRRGSRSDVATSPVESRNGRDGPVQLLQKPGHGNRDSYFSEDRSRRGSFTPSHDNNPRFRDRDNFRRDFPGPSKSTSNGFELGRSREPFDRNGGPPDRTRRMSNVSSSHLSPVDSSREGRPLPPHLSGSHPTPNMWRAPSERSRRLSTTSSVSGPPVRQPSHSPASTHAPLSPALGDAALVSSPTVDIDEVRKAAMHSAAERARLRRQQEEEEREKERERARRKAAEIEARLKAAEQAKAVVSVAESQGSADNEVVSIIEDAVKSATQSVEQSLPAVPEEPSNVSVPNTSRPPAVRAPSSRGGPRPPGRSSVDGQSPAAEVDSWRSKTRPKPTSEQTPQSTSTHTSVPPPPMGLVNHVDHLSLAEDENLEVVDFHEHGKLVGVHADDTGSVEPVSTSASTDSVSKRLRPVASDFFHDHHEAPPPPADNTPSSWRRRSSVVQDAPRLAPIQTTHTSATETADEGQTLPEHAGLQTTTMHPYPPSTDHVRPPLTIEAGHPHPDHQSDYANPLRSPYRQAPMAALNDTMARIRGAIDGMHHKPEPEHEPKQKWVPPARRPPQTPSDIAPRQPHRHVDHDEHIVREIFDVTGYEPPRSPKPAWNHFAVKVPRQSQEKAPLSLQQMRILGSRLYARLDIISLVPTGDGPRRREHSLNVNDWLFSKPYIVKGRPQFNVKLPRAVTPAGAVASASQPVVNLPAKSTGGRITTNGTFNRNRDADGLSSWRKPPASPLRQQTDLLAPPVGSLDTVSRSPPPETPSRTTGKSQGSVEAPVITVPQAKTKAQPNSSEGPAVAFYRDSPNNVTGRQTPPVNFVVNSELEDAGAKTSEVPAQGSSAQEPSHVSFPTLNISTMKSASQEQPLRPEPLSSSKDPIVEFRKGNPTPAQGPITPPTHPGNLPSLTWAAQREAALKESPSKPPDPEHLKAVWSSTSNKPEKPAVNSLRNIADDLNVPLNIQNAKMEDIPTPPPHTSTHASRMSIMHDITRQFQQVPTSSASSSLTASQPHAAASQSSNAHPPPPVASPAQRQPQLPPAASSGMRLPYPGYPSPMMSSPSPTLVYSQAMTPSPIPQQMMASSPYGQPMWVPVPPGGVPAGMMRPMGSPYGAQLMPYPPAGTMYGPPPNMQGPGMPSSPSVPGRPPANVMLGPSGSQGQPGPYPMYAASPVMMHAMPAMSAPAQGYPGPAQPRGPPPPPRGYDPHHPPAGMQPSPSYGPPQSPSYPHVQPNVYVRQTW